MARNCQIFKLEKMPRKSDSIPINNSDLDRRFKLTDEQRVEIKELYDTGNKELYSQRKLAAAYGVSRRLITFIVSPEMYEEHKRQYREKGGSMRYYDKDKHTAAIKEHREYKKQLYKDKLI